MPRPDRPDAPTNLFVAIVPPPDALLPLVAAVARLQERFPGLGWLSATRWHITLCFLGPVDTSDALFERLQEVAAGFPPIPLRLAGGGHFGNRVLWAGLEGELSPLAAEVRKAATRAGFSVEDRPFRGHLTLARARRRHSLSPLAADLATLAGPAWTVGEIVLLRGGPSAYGRLAAWPLTGS